MYLCQDIYKEETFFEKTTLWANDYYQTFKVIVAKFYF